MVKLSFNVPLPKCISQSRCPMPYSYRCLCAILFQVLFS